MATLDMSDKLAIMTQTSVAITLPAGGIYTVAANTPFTTTQASIDIPAGTVVAIMKNAKSATGDPIQVFSIDLVVTM